MGWATRSARLDQQQHQLLVAVWVLTQTSEALKGLLLLAGKYNMAGTLGESVPGLVAVQCLGVMADSLYIGPMFMFFGVVHSNCYIYSVVHKPTCRGDGR